MLTEAYVAGLTQENARKLIDRAHELNLPASVVRTVDGGFIVPAVLVQDPAETEPDEGKTKRSTRKAATKTQSADDSTADAVASEE